MRRVLVAFLFGLSLLAFSPTMTGSLLLPTTAGQAQTGNPYAKVWVDTANGIYHCPGSKYYGRGNGQYMYQHQAQQKGFRPAYGWVCA